MIKEVIPQLKDVISFNPYFIGLPILITDEMDSILKSSLVSILILLDYLFL